MSNKTYIIAEIGINHEGDIEKCKRMIDSAAECGADAVKLQSVNPDANYVQGTESYQIFKSSQLTQDETREAFDLAKELELDIFTTAGDIETIEWVEKLNPSHWKVSSGLLTHIPIIEYLAALNRPLLLSTGMGDEDEIDLAVKTAKSKGNNKISIFQCTSIYPTPLEEVNLSSIGWLKNKYKCPVGFSDHSLGDDAVFLSIAAGATLIEKHFTLDNAREGFDHKVSLDVQGFKKMVKRVRLAEKIMGKREKKISNLVRDTREKYLRYVVALKPISVGEVLTNKNVGIKRVFPGCKGIEPKEINNIFGRVSKTNYNLDELISLKDVT